MRYVRGFILFGLVLSLSLSAATVDGLKLHSTVTGKGSKTVILVHGYTCDETTWSEQVPALVKEYRVVTLDLPGHGKSDSPKDGKLSMDLFARAIEAVRAEVKANRVVLVGHSMGTPVILRYAHLYPQHISAMVFVDGLMPIPAAANRCRDGEPGRWNGRSEWSRYPRNYDPRLLRSRHHARRPDQGPEHDVGRSGSHRRWRHERYS